MVLRHGTATVRVYPVHLTHIVQSMNFFRLPKYRPSQSFCASDPLKLVAAVIHLYDHHLLLFSPKFDTNFIISQKAEFTWLGG